jgi:hypothetical protein
MNTKQNLGQESAQVDGNLPKDTIPRIVHMPLGDAVNNVEVKDMSPLVGDDDIEMAQFLRMQKKFDALINANEIKLSARVVKIDVIKGKERTDKATGVPLVDEFGQIRCYPDRYIATLAFQGGALEYGCNEDMYNELELNSTYLFKGRIGFIKEYGKEVTSPIFSSWQKVF